MACIVVLLGPGSAAMHASQSALGGQLDTLSMYLVASLAFSYAAMRVVRGGIPVLAVAFVAGVAFCELAARRGPRVPVISRGDAAFGLLLVLAALLEVVILATRGVHSRPWYGLGAVASILVAFAIWNATKSRTALCDPHSLLQGHAAWHLLDALSAYLLYRYYASEQVPAGGRQEEAPGGGDGGVVEPPPAASRIRSVSRSMLFPGSAALPNSC